MCIPLKATLHFYFLINFQFDYNRNLFLNCEDILCRVLYKFAICHTHTHIHARARLREIFIVEKINSRFINKPRIIEYRDWKKKTIGKSLCINIPFVRHRYHIHSKCTKSSAHSHKLSSRDRARTISVRRWTSVGPQSISRDYPPCTARRKCDRAIAIALPPGKRQSSRPIDSTRRTRASVQTNRPGLGGKHSRFRS